jgi:hypothetical protein
MMIIKVSSPSSSSRTSRVLFYRPNNNDVTPQKKSAKGKERKKMKRKRPEEGSSEERGGSIVPQILHGVKRGTVHSTLRLRETSAPKPGRNVHRLRAFYRAIVPDNTVSWGDLSLYLIFVLYMCVYVHLSLSLC